MSMTIENNCSHCGNPITTAVLSPSDGYGEAPCCSQACADEQERVSNFDNLPQEPADPALELLRKVFGDLRGEMWGDHVKGGKLCMDIDADVIDAALALLEEVKS